MSLPITCFDIYSPSGNISWQDLMDPTEILPNPVVPHLGFFCKTPLDVIHAYAAYLSSCTKLRQFSHNSFMKTMKCVHCSFKVFLKVNRNKSLTLKHIPLPHTDCVSSFVIKSPRILANYPDFSKYMKVYRCENVSLPSTKDMKDWVFGQGISVAFKGTGWSSLRYQYQIV